MIALGAISLLCLVVGSFLMGLGLGSELADWYHKKHGKYLGDKED